MAWLAACARCAPACHGRLVSTLFYIPFVLDEHWAETATYLFDHRIQSTFPHNGLLEFFERTIIYDASYLFFFLVGMTVIGQAVVLRKAWSRGVALLIVALTLAGLAVTFFVRPNWLVVGGTDHTWFLFALASLLPVLPRHVTHERAAWRGCGSGWQWSFPFS